MNQILISEKLYVTPELKRKKKMYKINFFLSIFLVCILFSYYIYAEYDRNKNEKVSEQIMASIDLKAEKDNTTIKMEENVLVVYFGDNDEEQEPIKLEDLVKDKTSYIYIDENGTQFNVAATLSIPKIDLEYPILTETSDELLKNALTKFWGPEANEVGNFVIAGHNYKNKKFFGRLTEMDIGDTITLTDVKGNDLTYEIYDIYTVDPSDTSCTSQETNGKKEVTLITCTATGFERLIIKARAK